MRLRGLLSRGGLVAVLVAASASSYSAGDPFELALPGLRIHTDRDGLPQNSVESIARDRDGRLWVATREGLAIFDGTRWVTRSLPDGAPSNWPRVVMAAADGSVWIGAEQGGIYRFRDGNWSNYDADDGVPDDRILALEEIEVRGERTLVAGTGEGLALWLPDESRFLPFPGTASHVVSAIEASLDSIFAGTGDGLVRFDGDRWVPVPHPGEARLQVTALYDSREGLLVGTTRGLLRYDGDRWSAVVGEVVSDAAISGILETGESLWVATEGKGVLVRSAGRWRAFDVTTGLPNNFVFDLHAWPERSSPEQIYAGTLSGLVEIDVDGWWTVDLASAVSDRSVVSFLEARRGDASEYLIGTTHGMARFRDGAWIPELPGTPVFAMLEGSDGTLWAGTDEGLMRLESGRWASVPGGLPRASVVALAEQITPTGSRLWVGTYGAGVWVHDDGRFRRGASLPDGRVEAILPLQLAGRSMVAVGTNRGLVLVDGGDTRVHDTSSGLPGDVVRALYLREGVRGQKELWVGTGRGVARADLGRSLLRWSIVDEKDLSRRTVYRIEQDENGRVYLFTSRGIVRLEMGGDGSVANAVTFTTSEGLPSNEINFGATMRDRRGRLWAGTPNGAAIFDPRLEREDPPGTLVIDEIRIGRESVPLASRYELDSDQSALAVEFRLIDLDGGSEALYRTQLVGAEDLPGRWSSSSRVDYAGLSSGEYVLRIEARDDQGRAVTPVEIGFAIAEPLWSRWWAVLGYVALLIVAIWWFVGHRERRLRERTQELERLVESRTRDLEASNRELASANRSLSDLTETDPLTGARNRRWVTLNMDREALRVVESTRQADDLILVLVDIDHFKSVNDRFGHAVGDRVLRHFQSILRRSMRDSDTIVRWGGEEFFIVARRTTREDAARIARRIVEEVRSEPFGEDGAPIELTCSVAIAPFPFFQARPELVSWEDVIDLTDQALYMVKRGGRNGWIALAPGDLPAAPLDRAGGGLSLESLLESGTVRRVG